MLRRQGTTTMNLTQAFSTFASPPREFGPMPFRGEDPRPWLPALWEDYGPGTGAFRRR